MLVISAQCDYHSTQQRENVCWSIKGWSFTKCISVVIVEHDKLRCCNCACVQTDLIDIVAKEFITMPGQQSIDVKIEEL